MQGEMYLRERAIIVSGGTNPGLRARNSMPHWAQAAVLLGSGMCYTSERQ